MNSVLLYVALPTLVSAVVSICKPSQLLCPRQLPSTAVPHAAYMAPEMQLNQLDSASQDDLKRSDMWSLGLVMHAMMNPELGSPYRVEIEPTGVPDTQAALKNLFNETSPTSTWYEIRAVTSNLVVATGRGV